jgi:hypothetical protein
MPLNPDLLDQLRAANRPPEETAGDIGSAALGAVNEYDQSPERQEIQRVQAKLFIFADRIRQDDPDEFANFESDYTVQFDEVQQQAFIYQLDKETGDVKRFEDSYLNLSIRGITGELSVPSELMISELYCVRTQITALPELPPSLTTLNYNSTQLTELPELPPSLTTLSCHRTKITALQELPPSLTTLNCASTQLTELPELPPSLITLICYDTKITALPELPPSLITLICYDTKITALPELPPSLITLKCHETPISGAVLQTAMAQVEENRQRLNP